MRKNDVITMISLILIAGIFMFSSSLAKQGASDGLILAQNTVIPSLMPLLIIFLMIMKTNAKDVLAKLFGFLCEYIFNLPRVTFPAVLLGLLGGYPSGAILTKELFDNGEIDFRQAQRMMCFNFCGGAGFIVTAVGSATLKNEKAGAILLFSNILSSVFIGFLLSFTEKRKKENYYSFTADKNIFDALNESVRSAVSSVLNITAYIVLFSSFMKIFPINEKLVSLFEITNGVCGNASMPLPLTSAVLSFGGLCIHFQIFNLLKKMNVKYFVFFAFRIISAFLSYCFCKALLWIFPVELAVFSAFSQEVKFSSVNVPLSFLMILGCFIIVLDVNSRKSKCF